MLPFRVLGASVFVFECFLFETTFKPVTRRSLEYESLRGTPSWQAKQNRARPLIARLCAERGRVWKARYRLKKSRISMGEDLPKYIQEIRKSVLIPAMKKIKQETPSHKATFSSTPNHFRVVRSKAFFSAFLFFCLCFLSNVCLSPLIIYFICTSSLNTLITNTLHSHPHFGKETAVKFRRCQRSFLTFSICPVEAFKT